MGTKPQRRSYRHARLVVRDRAFEWGARTYVMGVINVTPDSFSGDGTGGDPSLAVERARALEGGGADILDIGAESTRPDAQPIALDEELARLMPSLRAVRAATGLPISVDTHRAEVAEAALEAGADIVNDISGLRADPGMAAVIAARGAPLVAMHNQRGRTFHDVAGDIREGFAATLSIAADAGIETGRIVLDPGFGFGWQPERNLEMVRRLPELWDLELPLLMGVSRKSTIGFIVDRPADERVPGTAAAVALCVAAGADIVRVHDLPAMRDVVRVADAIARANWRRE